MEKSKCAKCGNNSFETISNRPNGSNYDLVFVRCSNCKSVVGVHESEKFILLS